LKDVAGAGGPPPALHHVGGSKATRDDVEDAFSKATSTHQGRGEVVVPEHSVVKIIVDVTAEIRPLCDKLSTF
jgi:hypothetical protein